ncbi:uncharacterized protein BKCO1_80003 [Diplodia corticola]|uniref:Uncharacterized protein n=1 Tax=Diplodia corticola TaxID=236234 RepID=A0A1J9SC56_9PEZI|nr:uncharacterized protein BKCO1_80003 [Diplodia corticola]OJD37165.1 hypothetical protein BKCO1_80003 [Diplodia corticola]
MPVTTRSAAAALAPLNANTPALRAAQRELQAKAILIGQLDESERTLTELVKRKKAATECAVAVLNSIEELCGGNVRRYAMRQGFRMLGDHGSSMTPPGSCVVWKNTSDTIDAYERLEEEKESREREWKEGMEELRVVRTRRKYAVRCLEVLRAYLMEVREKQQVVVSFRRKQNSAALMVQEP